MHRLLNKYEQLIATNHLSLDPAQLGAINILDKLCLDVEAGKPSMGVYLYGPVGRGKSMLMDMFFDTILVEKKQRLHFHHFMQTIHQQLRQVQGKKDPLKAIAKQWAKHTKVLCFDEFFVKDIGDAMILAGLLDAFFKAGIVFITTSNSHPTDLYKNGLQRTRFEPTIDLIMAHCSLVNVSGELDHRFSNGTPSNFYFENNRSAFSSLFETLEGSYQGLNIQIHSRPIAILGKCRNGLLIEFMSLCSSPRATLDYIKLALDYDVIFIRNVPSMGASPNRHCVTQGIEDNYMREKSTLSARTLDDEARRFIALVDEFYDRKKLIVIESDFSLQTLYAGELLAFEFERTKSRLVEMQSWHMPV
ncbi:cell division protein ZapE [Pseudoalteromonas luteoviolacea]|uniref:ATPase n=1 Tax=Pseudoalteromonas luteoviolacea H33 TaxID=1365251 RepID=A0A167B7Q3_9GAMM|nr:cell division protein ZapE [Pseudoalteromonas luteoviolacea]KZN46231.1 hypothetical protein N476_03650 [Pseudoalteromonas luteoviolacea H33]KZN75114.1 hypothetical protein N477_19745 [Pseudoalteromonas luteoviolacea H33-S]MBQ4875869.1 AFG1 family ATPase [Pseudoalteromonas luteoviolacea]MBQ4904904.1 AFG1 family ATPase [Pseudoalteromonas luteoviolacea]